MEKPTLIKSLNQINMKRLNTILIALMLAFTVFAQSPQAFKYQAVIRDGSGNIIANEQTELTIEVIQGSINNTALFSETHSIKTNAFGVINLELGSVNTTDFRLIDWSNTPYFVKIIVDGTEMGTSQLLSVPFALYANKAKQAENVFSGNYNDLINQPDLSNYLTVENDPIFSNSVASSINANDTSAWNNKSNFSGNYNDLTNKPNLADTVNYLKIETDPLFYNSIAKDITAIDTTNWNNKSEFSGNYMDLVNKPNLTDTAIYLKEETDPVFTFSIAKSITEADTALWNNYNEFSGDMGNQRITNLALPMFDNDAVTKYYVDSLINSSDLKSLSLAISQGADLTTLINSPLYSISDLLTAGATASNLYNAGATVDDLHSNGVPVSELLNYGASVQELVDSDIAVEHLLNASIPVADLLVAGVSAEELYNRGASITMLYANGVLINDILTFYNTTAEIIAANISTPELINSLLPLDSLIAAGVTIHSISGSDTDQEENNFNWTGIGNQVWMAENLKVTQYNDGTEIPYIEDTVSWINTTSAAYCWSYNDITYKDTWGALYNFYTIESGNVCPSGWHVPTYSEYEELVSFLDSEGNYNEGNSGEVLQATTGWLYATATDCGGSDIYGFKALPAGVRDKDGFAPTLGRGAAQFYTSTIADFEDWSQSIYEGYPLRFYIGGGCNPDGYPAFLAKGTLDKVYGLSIRCIKD